ncbi:uncharacterized protein DUF1801 [Winogradskyella epiphytica]|uniref:Uncharacterized protein DUF1801 n=1 Tax=Winogradskyella epiphytica TaxID=262005 RepID=A0A2V4WUL9_9FLAO|nr:DUF1801 domain-containing protein [Winogradskyella epiphytica]PYE80128.1 uncharacterized protein DUF1801 [Winogradskyella epiphytica]GGW71601.1 hypothetical protein GCM10008085_24600 [Winogradskyella epiphytica]
MNPAEEHILKQIEPYKSIMMHVQVLMKHVLPAADLLYKWRMPCFYIAKRPICYIHQSKDYVDVGFWHSAHLTEKWDAYLITEKRKVVKSLRYKSVDDINDAVFISILKEIEGLKEKGFYKRN